MPPFGVEFKQALGNGPATITDVKSLFPCMGLATLLAACVSYHVWRPLMPFTSPPSAQGAQTQTLIAAAGGSMVVVIGDNGIGMACGLGMSLMAIAGTAFVSLLLIIFDATTQTRSKRTLATSNAENPALIWPQIAKAFKNTRMVEMSNRVIELGKDSGKLVVELDLRGHMDAATIREVVEANQVPSVFRVALAE